MYLDETTDSTMFKIKLKGYSLCFKFIRRDFLSTAYIRSKKIKHNCRMTCYSRNYTLTVLIFKKDFLHVYLGNHIERAFNFFFF